MKDFEELSVQQLDCLVDGELSERERRDVLIAAEQEPDSWRRIALAFVEAQSLRQELPALLKPEVIRSTRGPKPVKMGALASLSLAGLVACSLFAFGLGRWSNSSDARVAQRPLTSPQFPPTFVDNGGQDRSVASSEPDNAAAHQTLRLVFDDLLGGPPQSVEVPVIDEWLNDPHDFLAGPPAISQELQRALLRTGRRVREERELLNVQLPDGRQGIVPVSNLVVENSGLNVFQ